MAAPWEKYQSAPNGGKPWEKYAVAPAQDVHQEPQMPEGQMWGQAVKNVAEAGGKLASGIVASPLADAAGLVQIPIHATSSWMNALRSKLLPASIADPLNNFASTEPADLQNAIKTAGTYQPSNPDSLSNKIVDAPGNVIGGAGEYLRSQSDKLDKSGTLGNVTAALPLAAANILGVKAAKLGTFNASKFGGPSDMPLPKGATTEAMLPKVPTTEELTAASKAAYAANKDAGIVVPAKGYETALDNVRSMVKQEGIDPTLHPKSTAVLKRLEDVSGKDLSLPEAETLRKIAMDAEDDINPVTRQPTPDARLAGKIVDELDNSIEQLSANNDARALWSRSRRSLMLDQMIKRAEIKAGANYTQAGMEHALRQEFKQLALNPRRMRGLTADQRAAVERVAKGGGMENTMRALGKFDPTTGGMASLVSLGTTGLLSSITGGAGAMLLPAGFAGKRIATRMTTKNVDLARQALVGRGLPSASTASPPIPAGVPDTALSRALIESKVPAVAPSKTRPPEAIRADIRQLSSRVQFELANEDASSPKVQLAVSQLQALQRELAASQANK